MAVMANHEGNLLPEIRSISVSMMEGMSPGNLGWMKEKKRSKTIAKAEGKTPIIENEGMN